MKIESILSAALLAIVLAGAACTPDAAESNSRQPDIPAKNVNAATNVDNQGNVNSNAAKPVNVVTSNSNGPTNQLRESTLNAKPAPDNSTITATMEKDGTFVEVREFKSDPMITKVVRKIYVDKSKYFVHLKSGKVVEAPADKMNNFKILAPANILDAIGMIRQPAPSNVTREMKLKMEQ